MLLMHESYKCDDMHAETPGKHDIDWFAPASRIVDPVARRLADTDTATAIAKRAFLHRDVRGGPHVRLDHRG